jgi:hypothetical protein
LANAVQVCQVAYVARASSPLAADDARRNARLSESLRRHDVRFLQRWNASSHGKLSLAQGQSGATTGHGYGDTMTWQKSSLDGVGPDVMQNGAIPRLRDDSIHPEHVQITPLDTAGRRALWIKFGQPFGQMHDAGGYVYETDGSFIELRAGREGDDSHVVLRAGEVLTNEKISELVCALLRTSDALGMT